jgi:hypothetical protein
MSMLGRWRVVETPGWNMAGPGAYMLFGKEGGEFAFDCLTGSLHGACYGADVEFDWDGTTRAKTSPAMAGPNFRLMAPLKARSASIMATIYPSSPIARLLQQPATAG